MRKDEPDVAERIDAINIKLMEAVNATGQAFLSHTRLRGRFVMRVAIASLRTCDEDLELVWRLLRDEAAALAADEK